MTATDVRLREALMPYLGDAEKLMREASEAKTHGLFEHRNIPMGGVEILGWQVKVMLVCDGRSEYDVHTGQGVKR